MKLSSLQCVLPALALGFSVQQASAWGNEGHEAIGLIAEHFLTDKARAEVLTLLAIPSDPSLPGSMRDRATWADAYRDSDRNTTKERYLATRSWHFVDLDIEGPDFKLACYEDGPAKAPASKGEADDCVVRKIEQFAVELADRSLPASERTLALMYLLHFVGDVHQPLHAAERQHDQGGNKVQIIVEGHEIGSNLHSYWDTDAVRSLGSTPEAIAKRLTPEISKEDVADWIKSQGNLSAPRQWAVESWAVAKSVAYDIPNDTRLCKVRAYGQPPIDGRCHTLSEKYVSKAVEQTREQLKKAAVRLADVLNNALR
jgi:hypothetical protein